jgi:molybdenum cofactor biosynthesis protein B
VGYHEHKEKSPRNVACAIFTISDTRMEETDESGRLLRERLTQNGHSVIQYSILKNDANDIRQKIQRRHRTEPTGYHCRDGFAYA